MKPVAIACHRLAWINFPGALLIALLQRTPVLRVATAAGEALAAAPVAAVIRSAVATAAALGAVHTLAGATQFVVSPSSVSGTVGTAIGGVAFAVTGASAPVGSYQITNLPPGLSVPGASGGVLNAASGSITGTPTTAGTFVTSILAYQSAGATGDTVGPATVTFTITGGSTAPSITTQPTSQSANAGATVTFSAAASGSPAPTFQWRKNGGNISGATSATLTLVNVQAGDAATYSVVATNSVNFATSNNATLTISVPPGITAQPVSQSVSAGATVSFTAAASATPSPAFQWLKNGAAISGATSATLTLVNVQASDAATYSVVASNAAGTATSTGATLTVSTAPAIAVQPVSQTANAGASVSFSGAATGTPSPAVQWRKNGVNISGATTVTLTLANVQPSDAATYSFVATNANGTATSTGATLTINVAPIFLAQPVSQTVGVGTHVSLTAAASGTPAPSFQWRKNGANLASATSATLTLFNVQLGDAGSYSVVTANAAGSALSAIATLTVTAGPGITTQPANLVANAGASVSFTVAASGTPAPAFQWLKNGALIAGETNATLALASVQPSDAATYSVVATNSAGATASNGATLAVVSPPVIAAQPSGQIADIGATAVFVVSANGTEPLGYQWFKDGVSLGASATGSSLTLDNVQSGDVGSYSVRVANAAGAVTSATAALSVAPPNPGRIVNLSILTSVTAAEPFFTVGTVIGGARTSGTKPLLVRAAGPSLAPFGVNGALADPKLDVFSGATVIASNDDWSGAVALVAAFNQVGAFAFASAASRDAAVYNPALPAGAYTVQVAGVGGAAGVVIAELYDATPASAFTSTTPRLVNVSVLKPIGAGSVLTAGFVIGGATSKTVLIRVIGPTLAVFGVSGVLADPKLELFSGVSKINENDNWGGGAALSAAFASVGAFPLADAASKDAVLLVTLMPGSYTAQASGVNGTGGTAIVEVYEVP